MPRSVWKGPYFRLPLLQQILADVKKEGVYTYERASTIIPAMVGAKLFVHRGNAFVPLVLREDMVGRRIGEFVPTKKAFSYRATNANKR
jgi:small subunit ribosomal protein S19